MKLRTVNEAVQELGVSKYYLRTGIKEKRFPALEWGGRLLVDIEELEPLIEEERRQREAHEGMIGLKDCAEAIGIKPESLRRMAMAGLVPHRKVGRYYRFCLADVMAAIRAGMK
jgi:hypothetical protein